jgi:hypothetical protein
MMSNGAGAGSVRRTGAAACAALLVAATCVVGATAAGQAGPAFKKVGGWGKVRLLPGIWWRSRTVRYRG